MTTKKLGIITAISVAVGCTIGSGVFVKPGRVLLLAGSSNLAILAWLMGGLMTLAGGLTIAEVASRIPRAGGVYAYVDELYGRHWAFVCGWVQSVLYGPALMAALSMFFSTLFVDFFHLDPSLKLQVAFITLVGVCAYIAVSTEFAAGIQNFTTFTKLVPIIAIGFLGLILGNSQIFGQTLPETVVPVGFGAAVLSTMWAYDGWMGVSNLALEIENPSKNLPKAIVIGLLIVIAAYMSVNISLFHTLPAAQIAELKEGASGAAAIQLFGPMGGALLSFGIIISIYGALNGNILTMCRVPQAMAAQGSFPMAGYFAKLHPTFQTPHRALLLQFISAAIMMLALNPDKITDMAIFSVYLFYAAVFLGVFKLRKLKGLPAVGEYRIPLYPIVPLFAAGAIVYVSVSMVIQDPKLSAISAAIALVGYPISLWLEKKEKSQLGAVT